MFAVPEVSPARLAWRALALACLAFALMVASAGAATTSVSSFTKSGRDLQSGSTASAGGAAGTTAAGHTLQWVMNYRTATGGAADVNITDPIAGNQSYVSGSLQAPPGFTKGWSTNGGSSYGSSEPGSGVNAVRAMGSVPADSASSPAFTANAVSFNTPGGDGYSVEGSGGNIYTVFHHNHTDTVVYCATLAGGVCPGWPAQSTYVNPTPGTPLGTGGIGDYTTAAENGSFIANGNLYWPVEDTVASGGSYAVGVQCLNLTTLVSCGFTQLDTEAVAPLNGQNGMISSDGIPAADGNYYFFDTNGNMLCFNPSSGACGSVNVTSGQSTIPTGYTGSILTSGQYVYETYINTAGTLFMTCYDTAASSVCSGFPKNEGVPASPVYPPYIAPVLSSSGALLGVCDVSKGNCYSPTGATLANPYVGHTTFGDPVPGGFGSGAIVGSRFYTAEVTNPADANTTTVLCFDFSSWSGSGPVPQCSGFSGPVDPQNYTVRALANLPGCMAANGNAGVIVIFNAQTGGSCVTASQQVALKPFTSFCDGQSHPLNWGKLTLNGLTGSEYASATVTLTGVNGPVPGFTNLKLGPGQTTIDLSSVPISGNTAQLTAQVTLSAVTDSSAVNAATITLSWAGAPVQVCFKTKVGQAQCKSAQTLQDTGNAVTALAGGASDAPGGNGSGTARFTLPADHSLCPNVVIDKRALQDKVTVGDPVTYLIVARNTGPKSAATAVVIDDTVPAQLRVTSASSPQGPCTVSGNAIHCSVGTIAVGHEASVVVRAVAVGTGAPVNTASVSSKDCLSSPCDDDPANVTIVKPALRLSKQVGRRVLHAGQTTTYRIRVRNPSAATLHKVQVCDRLPSGLVFVSAKPSASLKSGQQCWTLSTLGAHASKTFKLKVRALRGTSGKKVNHAKATSPDAKTARAKRTVRVIAAAVLPADRVTG